MSMSIRSPLSEYKQAFKEVTPEILKDGKIDKQEIEKLKNLTNFLPPEQKATELKNIDKLVQSVNNKTHLSQPNTVSFKSPNQASTKDIPTSESVNNQQSQSTNNFKPKGVSFDLKSNSNEPVNKNEAVLKGSVQKNILSILNENTKDVKNESKTEDKTKVSNVNLKKGDDWGGGKVLAVNVDPTGYRNVSKGIEGGVYDTTFDQKSYDRFKSQESKGKAPAGKAEAYKQKHLLQNLQDCLSGKSDHVSLAFDKQLYENGTLKKGQKFRIPELEKAYGKSPIVFVAQDTGSDFTGKGFSRMDICTRDEKDPKTGKLYESDPRLNESKLTLVKMP